MSPWSVTAFGSRGRRIACLDPGALKPVSERRTLHRCLPKLGSSMNFIWNAGLVCIRQQQINNPERIFPKRLNLLTRVEPCSTWAVINRV